MYKDVCLFRLARRKSAARPWTLTPPELLCSPGWRVVGGETGTPASPRLLREPLCWHTHTAVCLHGSPVLPLSRRGVGLHPVALPSSLVAPSAELRGEQDAGRGGRPGLGPVLHMKARGKWTLDLCFLDKVWWLNLSERIKEDWGGGKVPAQLHCYRFKPCVCLKVQDRTPGSPCVWKWCGFTCWLVSSAGRFMFPGIYEAASHILVLNKVWLLKDGVLCVVWLLLCQILFISFGRIVSPSYRWLQDVCFTSEENGNKKNSRKNKSGHARFLLF